MSYPVLPFLPWKDLKRVQCRLDERGLRRGNENHPTQLLKGQENKSAWLDHQIIPGSLWYNWPWPSSYGWRILGKWACSPPTQHNFPGSYPPKRKPGQPRIFQAYFTLQYHLQSDRKSDFTTSKEGSLKNHLTWETRILGNRKIHETIGAAQEEMHNIKVKKSKGSILKIDPSKYFDRVSWIYLRLLLTHLGFNYSIIKWIFACISTTSFSVLINGSTSSFPPSERASLSRYQQFCKPSAKP